ncbi:MAG: hypothetical protein E7543_01255 [Ruminococcaceae bacterium]|nr:hypothetical protein [Oscillospiraceae bacterium]
MDKKKNKGQVKPFDGKKKKRKSRRSSRYALVGAVVLTAVLIILGAAVFSADRVIDDGSVSSENSELLSTVSSNEMGFPVTFSNNDIIRVESFSSRLFVLGKKILTCVSDRGAVKYNHIFTFTNPDMTVSENYGLVYDRASCRYFIFNEKGIIYEGESENKKHIITAKINNRGDVALVTKSDDSACRVSLVDKKGRVLYIWACANEYGVCLDMSEDSREILCGTIGSLEGSVYSKLYLLGIYSDSDVKEMTVEDNAVVDVRLSGRRVIATCNGARVVFTVRGSEITEEKVTYPSKIIALHSDKSGNTAVVTNKVGSFGTNEITVYNKNNAISYVGFTDGEIVDVICRGKRVYLLTDSAIYESCSDGSFSSVGTKEISGEGLVICKSRLYYYSKGHIDINS